MRRPNSWKIPCNRRNSERVALGYEHFAANAEARQRTAELVATVVTRKSREP